MHKIILDTNIIVSALITNADLLKQLLTLHDNQTIKIFSSELLHQELKETLQKPKIKDLLKVNAKKIASFMAYYRYRINIVEHPIVRLNICRDPKDNMFLELANEINADYLITGDNDLLVLKKFNQTKILKPSEWLAEMKLEL